MLDVSTQRNVWVKPGCYALIEIPNPTPCPSGYAFPDCWEKTWLVVESLNAGLSRGSLEHSYVTHHDPRTALELA